ncbi:proliferating cell nuclear antigen [Nematocida sp. AWRm80]|nr:proliferating cell nuclear antigen [Nematocida sp. AWRm80]
MFELRIGKSTEEKEEKNIAGQCTFSALKKLIEGVEELVKQAAMKVTPEGIYIQVMDTMQVCMVDLFIKSTSFESYRCDKTVSLGLPLTSILKVFKSLPTEDVPSILLSADDEGTVLNVICECDNRRRYSHQLKLLDISSEEYTSPVKEYEASINLIPGEFTRIIKVLGTFGEAIQIAADTKGLLFTQISDLGTSEVFFAKEETKENGPEKSSFDLDIQNNASLIVPFKHVNTFTKFSSLGNNITIGLSNEMPLYMTTKMAMGYLNYYIAPRDE